jgi:hypothetical protein
VAEAAQVACVKGSVLSGVRATLAKAKIVDERVNSSESVSAEMVRVSHRWRKRNDITVPP